MRIFVCVTSLWPACGRPDLTPQSNNRTRAQLFLDAHLLTHRANRVAVLAASPERSAFLYPPPHTHAPTPPAAEEGNGQSELPVAAAAMADKVGHAVVEGLRRLLAEPEQEREGQQQWPRRRQGSLVAQALSKGLCCKWVEGWMWARYYCTCDLAAV